jgi:predicted DsbA family dithiol-disulfide isomerase
LERLEESHPVEVTWRSFELRPKGSPPIPAEYRAKIEENRPQLYATAREQYGVEINPGPFGIDSRPALIATKYAEAHGVGKEFHRAAMHAYWVEAKNIEVTGVLEKLAEEVGLDREAFLKALAAPHYAAEVDRDISQARTFGLSGVPAMVFDEKYLIPGAVPYPVLVEVVEKIQVEQD